MQLHWDILIHVIAVLPERDRPNRSRLMRTCRTLYDAGLPLLLRGEIILHTGRPRNIRSFHRFIATLPHRAQYVRELSFWDAMREDEFKRDYVHSHPDSDEPEGYDQGAIIQLVVEILGFHPHLSILFVSDAEVFLRSHRDVEMVVRSLRNLTKLAFWDGGRHAAKVIQAIQAPLSIACVGFTYSPDDDEDDDGEEEVADEQDSVVEPIRLLNHFRDTLTEMCLAYPAVLTVDPSITYPHVRLLELKFESEYDPINLASAFPCLQGLIWFASELYYTENKVNNNRMGHLARRQSSGLRDSAWKSLEYLCSSISRTCSMGLTLPVRFWDGPSLSEAYHVRCLQTVIADITPTVLWVEILVRGFKTSDFLSMFKSGSVTHLWLVLNFYNCSEDQTTIRNIVEILVSHNKPLDP